jgi:cadherin 17 (LI cadherin)
LVHAVAVGAGRAEEPMEIIVQVIDMNDNKPVFTQDPFTGIVPEASLPGVSQSTLSQIYLAEF